MNLKEGESRAIESITAIYLNSGSKDIAPSACSYSSNSNNATVSSSGIVTGISDGPATITVSYTDAEITKTTTVIILVGIIQISPPVSNPIVYRALLVGVGDYENFPDYYPNPSETTDLNSPPHNVDRMIDVFNNCKFGTEEVSFSSIASLKDFSATKASIMSKIASTFSGADDNDVSYFYFTGHGSYTGAFITSYICPTDFDGTVNFAISVDELESALSAIPGRKVVILGSCHSGGFIGKGKGEITISKEELISFNDEIINLFSQAQSKGLLTTNQYKVLTSCHYDQSCWETSPHPDGNPYGVFTRAFCNGCGYDDGVSHADSNSDTKITLDELYEYIRDFIIDVFDYDQDVQVFPENSNFTIVEH
jgi:hypothetical protein